MLILKNRVVELIPVDLYHARLSQLNTGAPDISTSSNQRLGKCVRGISILLRID